MLGRFWAITVALKLYDELSFPNVMLTVSTSTEADWENRPLKQEGRQNERRTQSIKTEVPRWNGTTTLPTFPPIGSDTEMVGCGAMAALATKPAALKRPTGEFPDLTTKKKKKISFFSAKYLLIFSYLKVMYIGPSVAMDAFKAADEQPLHKKMHI